MIGSGLDDLVCDNVFLDVSQCLAGNENKVYIKIEGFNPAGSIKIKAAKYLLEDAFRNHLTLTGVIESSSGNLGIALAMLCAARGIPFECVVDANALEDKVALIRYFGAKVMIITQRDANGGYLGTRIDYIKNKIKQEKGLVWTNQYANRANILAHYNSTAAAIVEEFQSIDYLFVGAGTTGTLFGCTKYFAEFSPTTKVIAIDSVGSVTFGGPPGARFIPGIGTSQRPGFVEQDNIPPADIIYVPEQEGLQVCRKFSRQTGLLVGGSTGSVIAGFERYVAERGIRDAKVVLISPDLGHAYLSTIYSDEWVHKYFPVASDNGPGAPPQVPLLPA
ncbi:2,3-diaminopropionate biosynthesis protein SbnA [Xanthomonas campestris pv. phormiicola]|nr:2,3-diaminopropionate biosynthesis protein SbnA [Xanthomonas campestris pv. phormiicola]UYC17382.1 2,3-diaminopropionate biosynthesis protein SbnA [Xanthomonas campestris pv. phormiicola]